MTTYGEVTEIYAKLTDSFMVTLDDGEVLYVPAGDKLELPEPEAQEGKNFKGWVYYTYEWDEEFGWEVEVEHPAPEVMPAENLELYATWDVIPYLLTIKLSDTESIALQIGIEDVYDEEYNTIIYDYTNGSYIQWAIEQLLKVYATETVAYEVVGFEYDEEGNAVFAELKDYQFTVQEVERVYVVTMPDYSEVEYKYGDVIELPTPDPIDGAEFVKWAYYFYNEDLGDYDILDVPATASSIIDGVMFKQIWNVTPYTLTLNNVEVEYVYDEETDTYSSIFGTATYTFGVMYDAENGIYETIDSLAWILEFSLPEGYVWDKAIPETWEAKDYNFTALPVYTMSVVNGEETIEVTFAQVAADGVDCAVADLAAKLAELLPAEDAAYLYAWAEKLPATFELQDYTFTVVKSVKVYTLTIKQEGKADKEFKFANELAPGVNHTVGGLASVLANHLPADDTNYYITVQRRKMSGCKAVL